jgi:hypothetical protein
VPATTHFYSNWKDKEKESRKLCPNMVTPPFCEYELAVIRELE